MKVFIEKTKHMFGKKCTCGLGTYEHGFDVYKEPPWADRHYCYVLTRYRRIEQRCKICNKVINQSMEYITGYNSVSLPNKVWDKIKEQGWCSVK